MSIETLLQNLIDAVNANTAALQGAGKPVAAATGDAEKTTRTRTKKEETKAPASTRSKAEMQAAVNEVKEALGTAKAKELIKKAGFDRLADVTEDKYDELYDSAKALLTTDGVGEQEDDGL